MSGFTVDHLHVPVTLRLPKSQIQGDLEMVPLPSRQQPQAVVGGGSARLPTLDERDLVGLT